MSRKFNTFIDKLNYYSDVAASASAETTNNKSYVGIEIGINIFANPKLSKDDIIQVKDEDGNILPFNLHVATTTSFAITITSGVAYHNARIIIK